MKNKFNRSVTAIMLTAALLISSQGVVTAFADGENYSDTSEYSSVQTTEVKDNETPSSNKNNTDPEQKKCTCGAVDDNTHDENCPLYVKPDGGNTDGDNTEDDAAQCTCGAKEGEPHQEDCPLYVKPDGGNTDGNTDDGTSEDADIKSVVDAINALPAVEDLNEETNYEELKAQVLSARAAYDALSEGQKVTFDTAVLDKLTALEAKISELESSEQETAPSEAVQNVIEKIDAAIELIDHTTETIPATDGTTVNKTHITMLKDLDPANNAELKALIDKEAAHDQDETQPALTEEEAAQLEAARKVFEDAKAKYLSEGFSNAQLAARQAYDALATEEEKSQVTNYSLLTDMEENIAYIMQVVNTLPETPENTITHDMDQNKINSILNSGATEITIKDGTYSNVSINVKDKTLIVDGVVKGIKGLTLTDATLQGKTGRDTDQMEVSGDGTLLYLKGTENNLKDVTLTCNGNQNGNYIAHWDSNKFNITDSSFSCNGNQTSYGGGLFPATGSDTLEATDSILDFSNNGKTGINASMSAGDGCNPNAKFFITGGSFRANNNGLNGVESTYRFGAKLTFVFENCDVEAKGNGNNPNSGKGDGFSYGYVTLKNTDTDPNKKYTFDVSNNGNNGFDGGARINAALDANGYHIIANDNGNIGINISKLNEGKSESSITDCIVEANGNGAEGIRFYSYSGNLSINNSSVTADGNTGSGLYFYGNELTTSGNTSIVLNNNQNSGLYVYKGTADLSGADITIKENFTKFTSKYSTDGNGGGIYNKGTLTLPAGAKVYNNHAETSGDDIYNANGATITNLPSVGTDWILDDCNDLIDGWYDDSAKVDGDTNTGRWEMHNETQRHILPFAESTISQVTALKAAHGIPTPPVDPEDPTPTPDPDPNPNPRPGAGGDEDDDTPTIINETPVPTTTIEDEDVPMADLPEDTVTIDDEEVPLKDNPNTGDTLPVAAMAAAALSLGGVIALNRKKK